MALRERIFYVRLRTMVKNRIVTAFDRYPEQTAVLRRCADLFGTAGRKQLAALAVSPIDRLQIDRSVAFIDDINRRIKECETTIKALSKGNENVKTGFWRRSNDPTPDHRPRSRRTNETTDRTATAP